MAKKKIGRPPGAQTVGGFRCPNDGRTLMRRNRVKTEGFVSIQKRGCTECGFEAEEISFLATGLRQQEEFAAQMANFAEEVQELLHLKGGDADGRTTTA